MLKDIQDAYGHELYDYLKNTKQRQTIEVTERDDGYIGAALEVKTYFNEYNNWPSLEKNSMKYARGKILDIGCGAGRHSLYLQGKGFEVLGIDISPLAIEVCETRGLRNAKVMSINQINSRLGTFDTVLMLGNNFGLFGSFEKAKRLLIRLNKVTSKKGRIIAQTNDVYKTKNPNDHLSYHDFNRKRGRMAGQIRMRVRYKKYATPWLDYLMVSKEEMENILDGTDWKVNKFIESESANYIAIIDKIR